MKRLLYLGITVVLALFLSGCGGDDGGHSRPIFVAQILSDQLADGDIAFDPVLNSFIVTNGPDTIFFGIDEVDRDLPEFRAFLDFPLDGSLNGDVVPASAEILSATLEVFVDEVSFAGTVPTLLDLVPFSITGLSPADFDSPPLQFSNGSDATIGFDFFASDQNNFVLIDVTPLMREAQRLGLAHFQVRFLLDFVSNAGLVGIQDLPNVTVTAPLLTVEYR
ncbi:MAG: hypothetical protein HZB61_05465 [Nitrospirae bacterium]|nr:hypothetical protein [Nitrospirota bacterium]